MKTTGLFFTFVTIGSLVAAANSVSGEQIVVSADANIINPLSGSFGAPLDPGNATFFNNVLGGGNSVVVQGPVGGGDSTGNAAGELNTYYNSVAGVSSSVLGGPVTSGDLSGADLFVSILPSAFYTPGEISALSSFLAGGGSIFFIGENDNFSAQNERINTALASLGSGMSIVNNLFDAGFHTASGSQIGSDALTAGVSSLTYAAPSNLSVDGGTALFFGSESRPFIAVEREGGNRVPDAGATASLFGIAVASVMVFRRRSC